MRRSLAVSLVLLSVAVAYASADETPKPKPDRYGDPLPAGALARLGTLHFRHTSHTTAVAYSTDGKLLASGSEDHTIRIWQMPQGKEVARFDVQQTPTELRFTANNAQLVSWAEGIVRIHDLAAKKETKKYGVFNYHATISPDGARMASADTTGQATLTEVATGKVIFDVHADSAFESLAWSPDGKHVALGGRDNAIRIWDVDERTETRILGHEGWVTALAWTPDGKTLVSGSADRSIRLWQGDKLTKKLEGTKGFVQRIVLDKDGKLAAVLSDDSMLALWDLHEGKERSSRHAAANAIAFSPDAKLLALATGEAVTFVNVDTFKDHEDAPGHGAIVTCLVYSADGRSIISGGADGTIRVWDVAGTREIRRLDAHEGSVSSLALSQNGRILASGGSDATIRLWETGKWTSETKLEGHTDSVTSLFFTGFDLGLVSFGDATVRVWPLAGGKPVRQIGVGGDAGPLASVHGGEIVAVGTGDNKVRVIDANAMKDIFVVEGQKRVLGLAFSKDEKTLVIAGEEPALALVDIASHEKREITVADKYVGAVAYSPDGKKIAIGRTDGPVRILEMPGGKEIKALETAGSGAFAIAWSPDGKQVAWASADGCVYVGDGR